MDYAASLLKYTDGSPHVHTMHDHWDDEAYSFEHMLEFVKLVHFESIMVVAEPDSLILRESLTLLSWPWQHSKIAFIVISTGMMTMPMLT